MVDNAQQALLLFEAVWLEQGLVFGNQVDPIVGMWWSPVNGSGVSETYVDFIAAMLAIANDSVTW